MKKMFLALGAIVSAAIVTSCAGIATNNGGPATYFPGYNVYTEGSYIAFIGDVQSTDYTVVQHGITGEATIKSFFGIIHEGDASFQTLKEKAFFDNKIQDADDMIDIRIDYDQNNILGINKVKVKMTGTAIKYKK